MMFGSKLKICSSDVVKYLLQVFYVRSTEEGISRFFFLKRIMKKRKKRKKNADSADFKINDKSK